MYIIPNISFIVNFTFIKYIGYYVHWVFCLWVLCHGTGFRLYGELLDREPLFSEVFGKVFPWV